MIVISGFLTRMIAAIQRLRGFKRLDGSLVSFRLRQKLLPVFILAIFLWYLMNPTAIALMSLLVLSMLFLLSYGWVYLLARGVWGERKLAYTALQVGDVLEETIHLNNPIFLPLLWVKVVDHSTIPGYAAGGISAVGSYSSNRLRVHTTCTRRGVYVLGPWELIFADPFGIFEAQLGYEACREVVVYPQLASVPLSVIPQSQHTGDRRFRNQPVSAETVVAASVRPYQLGDPLRHIHWRTTARRGSWFVKVFSPQSFTRLWLLLDFDRAAHSESGEMSTLEKMISLAATLAQQLLQQRIRVGLLAFADEMAVVPPLEGEDSLWRFLRALASLGLNASESLGDVLPRAASLIAPEDSILLLTPAKNADWIKDAKALLHDIRGGNLSAIFLDAVQAELATDWQPVLERMAANNISAKVVHAQDIHLIQGAYGALRRWEFATYGTGKVVVRQSPRSSESDEVLPA